VIPNCISYGTKAENVYNDEDDSDDIADDELEAPSEAEDNTADETVRDISFHPHLS
jgi:hypothetical protein